MHVYDFYCNHCGDSFKSSKDATKNNCPKCNLSGCIGHDYGNITKVQLGQGTVMVAEGSFEGEHALMFSPIEKGEIGRNIDFNCVLQRPLIAVLQFSNVKSLDVVIARLQTLRQRIEQDELFTAEGSK